MESQTAFSRPPKFEIEQAVDIARVHFGLRGEATELPSERDQNFRIRTSSGPDAVLKIANPDTPPAIVELENSALQIASPIHCFESPRLLKTLANSPMVTIRDPSGNDCLVRMISFLDGETLAKKSELPDSFFLRFGAALAQLDLGLQHLNQQTAARRDLKWDLDTGPNLVRDCLAQNDWFTQEKRELLSSHVSRFEQIESRIKQLPKAVIHNDANDHNILIHDDSANGVASIGLIDFGDLMFTTQVNELAIAGAYVLLRIDGIHRFAEMVHGYHRHRPLSSDEQSAVYPLAIMRLCQSVCIAAQQRQARPDNEYLSVTEGPAWETLARLATVPPSDIQSSLNDACFGSDRPAPSEDRGDGLGNSGPPIRTEIHQRRVKHIGPSLSLSYDKPLHIVRGKGQYLYDPSDITYLDCVNNVCHVGHCNPRVVEAIQHQAVLLNTNTRYLHENLVRYAERLSEKLPDPLNVCYFVNSGSEANDLALRMAAAFTGGNHHVVLDHAYHGHTASLIDISPYKFNRAGGAGRPEHVSVLPMPDGFRGKFRADHYPDDWHVRFASDAVQQIQQLEANKVSINCLIAESLLGCGGQVVLPPNYLKQVFSATRQAGGVCIADEVQVGFGRVGEHFWGFELQGVTPDIVTMGKPIGNGHPLAAVVTTPEIAEAFNNGMEYFNTFGGNPVSCAAGLAVLDEIEQEGLQQHALEIGNQLLSSFRSIQEDHPIIGDVRGSGLFLGLEMVKVDSDREPDSHSAKQIVERMKARRILLSTDGPENNVIKFKPPMVFSAGDADRLAMTLAEELRKMRG